MKEKTGKVDFIKNFCSPKDIKSSNKRQATKFEKVFAKHVSDKELVSKIYKKLSELNSKETTQLRNWQNI